VVGAGQAGLPTAYRLTQAGRSCLALEAGERVGDDWRQQRWDWLRLYSPARYGCFPGTPFPGHQWHFPGKDEVADYLGDLCGRWTYPCGRHRGGPGHPHPAVKLQVADLPGRARGGRPVPRGQQSRELAQVLCHDAKPSGSRGVQRSTLPMRWVPSKPVDPRRLLVR
jgi:choline dehydrogenase-like flavoprotein